MKHWSRVWLVTLALLAALLGSVSLVAAQPAQVRDHLNQTKTAATEAQKHIDLALAQAAPADQRMHVQDALTYAAEVKKHANLALAAAASEPAAANHINDVIKNADLVIEHGNLALKAPDAQVKGHITEMGTANAAVLKHIDLALAALPASGATPGMPNTGAGGGAGRDAGWLVVGIGALAVAGGLFLRRRVARR